MFQKKVNPYYFLEYIQVRGGDWCKANPLRWTDHKCAGHNMYGPTLQEAYDRWVASAGRQRWTRISKPTLAIFRLYCECREPYNTHTIAHALFFAMPATQ